jgi:GTPase
VNESLNTKSLFVSIVGNPNAGKSSIMNMILGSKISIVSSKPQTTRNKITGIFTQGNIQLVFIDTPGIHRPRTLLGDYMVSEINNSFSGSEICLHVVDSLKRITESDIELIKKFKKSDKKVILVLNKIDLIKDKSVLMQEIQEFSKLFDYEAVVPVSAKTGDGKDILINEISKLAKPSVFFFPEDDITDQTERTMVSEIIREKLLRFLDKELPHGVAVCIEKFKERENNITDIEATIYCERSSHKGIIIGEKGRMLKEVGSAARLEAEEIFNRKINLKLWVKVKENWRNKNSVLNTLGYIKGNA